MKQIIGSCPQCGAPIYTPTVWMGIIPPPPEYTCDCRPVRHRIVTTTSTGTWLPEYRRPPATQEPD